MTSSCYCIRLRRAARKISTLYDEALAPHGINVAQYSLLKIVLRHGPINLTELAAKAELERSTMGRNVQVLERAGLLSHERGEDQREQLIVLTVKGRDVLDRAAPDWSACQSRIEGRLGEQGMKSLDLLLDTL
jgi:DNA-binding MarR family transcriptional regulator